MNRRSFFQLVGGVFCLGVAATQTKAKTTVSESTSKTTYCVEIYSPFKLRDRTLPLFDSLRHARNYAYARQKSMVKDDINSGKILITLPNGTVCENITWGYNWSQTVAYTNYTEERWKI